MPTRALALRIASLQYAFLRQVNDTHIFLQKAKPLFVKEKSRLEKSPFRRDRRYCVPYGIGRKAVSARTDVEAAAILHRFLSTELYKTFLVTAVSQFESFLGRVLREILTEYPRKLSILVKEISPAKVIPIDVLLDSDKVKDAVQWAIERTVNNVFYASPKAYIEYLKKVGGIDTSENTFIEYLEIKATRDLITHNSGVINEVYVTKAGNSARGSAGEFAEIDEEYFDKAIGILKRLSGIVKRDAEKTFPVKAKG